MNLLIEIQQILGFDNASKTKLFHNLLGHNIWEGSSFNQAWMWNISHDLYYHIEWRILWLMSSSGGNIDFSVEFCCINNHRYHYHKFKNTSLEVYYNHTMYYLSIVCKPSMNILNPFWVNKSNISKDFGSNMIKITSWSSLKHLGINLELTKIH